MSELPTELILLILEDASKTDVKSCSLVCRAWTSASQSILFQTVKLVTDSDYQNFHNLLRSSPHIAPLVHDFSATVRNASIQIRNSSLASTFPLLRNITSVTLDFGNSSWNDLSWNDFPSDLRTAIIDAMQTPTLTDLSLEHCSFKATSIDSHAFFQHAARLTKLTLWTSFELDTNEGSDQEQQSFQSTTPPSLESLEISLSRGHVGVGTNSHAWLSHCIHSIDLGNVRSFRATGPFDGSIISNVLQRSPLLECLDLDTYYPFPDHDPSDVIDLSNNPALHYFSINTGWHLVPPEHYPPAWLEASLRTLPPTNVLKKLDLILWLTPRVEGNSGAMDPKPSDCKRWRTFASFLASGHLGLLQGIVLQLGVRWGNHVEPTKEAALREMQELGDKIEIDVISY